MVTIAVATPNASTLLDRTGVNVHLATSTLMMITPAQVSRENVCIVKKCMRENVCSSFSLC